MQPEAHAFEYVDLTGTAQTWNLPAHSLAFTCCQVPVSYVMAEHFAITIEMSGGKTRTVDSQRLSEADSRAIFSRTGEIIRLTVGIPTSALWERSE